MRQFDCVVAGLIRGMLLPDLIFPDLDLLGIGELCRLYCFGKHSAQKIIQTVFPLLNSLVLVVCRVSSFSAILCRLWMISFYNVYGDVKNLRGMSNSPVRFGWI